MATHLEENSKFLREMGFSKIFLKLTLKGSIFPEGIETAAVQ